MKLFPIFLEMKKLNQNTQKFTHHSTTQITMNELLSNENERKKIIQNQLYGLIDDKCTIFHLFLINELFFSN